MTTEEMQKKLEELKDSIDNALSEVARYEELIRQIKEQEEPKFERVLRDNTYYMVKFASGEAGISAELEEYLRIDNICFNNNNYFHTAERAEEVADKVNFLLRLERLHDIYCPDYAPDWDDDKTPKWYVYYDVSDEKFVVSNNTITKRCVDVYFDGFETVNKVCEILNAEL